MESKLFLYCHFFTDSTKGVLKTKKLSLENLNLHIIDLKQKVEKLLQQNPDDTTKLFKLVSVNVTLFSRSLLDSAKVSNFFENGSDVFCQVELNLQPLKTILAKTNQQDELLTYKTLSSYSFYEASKQIVKVLIPLKGVENLPKENIKSTFTESSLEVKINNLNNLNYCFRVPRLDASIIPEKSEAFADKNGNVVIRLRKAKEDDHWSYLFKQKYVGEN
jgi:hypothetical protein